MEVQLTSHLKVFLGDIKYAHTARNTNLIFTQIFHEKIYIQLVDGLIIEEKLSKILNYFCNFNYCKLFMHCI